MRYSFILLAAIMLSAPAFSQNKTYNDANAERRNVSGFHGISMSGGIDLYLTQGEEAVAVSASKAEYRDKIKTVVENGVLKIYYDGGDNWFSWSMNGRKLKAYVSVKDIDLLRASGGSDVVINGTLAVAKLNLDLSGGSDFKGAVNVSNTLSVDMSGGSDVDISGSASNLAVDASGGSDFNGYNLSAETCHASGSGGSDIHVNVNKELSADASGGSDIHYRGNASVKKSSSSGGSSVTKRN